MCRFKDTSRQYMKAWQDFQTWSDFFQYKNKKLPTVSARPFVVFASVILEWSPGKTENLAWTKQALGPSLRFSLPSMVKFVPLLQPYSRCHGPFRAFACNYRNGLLQRSRGVDFRGLTCKLVILKRVAAVALKPVLKVWMISSSRTPSPEKPSTPQHLSARSLEDGHAQVLGHKGACQSSSVSVRAVSYLESLEFTSAKTRPVADSPILCREVSARGTQ
jgi:hypothetical protein